MQQSFLKRLVIYQKERFPLLVHVPLIAAFSFSAIGYARACRGLPGFIPLADFLACIYTNITLFFMLRVADEHKDQADDAMYRSYLPVPRGLVSLKELRYLAAGMFLGATALNLLAYPALLPLYLLMMGYLLLMRYEFFAVEWLRKRQLPYILSHMLIIPLADVYASSYDWKLAAVEPPVGLLFFLTVSYLSGLILEIGRKIRVPETEEEGVLSYTRLWGLRTAVVIWALLLLLNFTTAYIASRYVSAPAITYWILYPLFAASILPAILFLLQPGKTGSKLLELMSLLWALGMYLSLGGIPLLLKLSSL